MVVRRWKNHQLIVYNVFRLIVESHGSISIACIDMASNDKDLHRVVVVVFVVCFCCRRNRPDGNLMVMVATVSVCPSGSSQNL
jgi:hypothetical protein